MPKRNLVIILVITTLTIQLLTSCTKETVYIKEPCQCFSLHPKNITFNYLQDTINFRVINKGTSKEWSLECDNQHIDLVPGSGTLNENEEVVIKAVVNREGLEGDSIRHQIVLTSQGQVMDSAVCLVLNYQPDMVILDRVVVDAVYLKESDRLIFTSSSPNSLNIFHAGSREFIHYEIDELPACIEASEQLDIVAMGYDKRLDIRRLSDGALGKSYDVSYKINDLEISGAGWVYTCPAYSSQALESINLNNDSVYVLNNYTDGENGYLHPSEEVFYISDNYDVTRYDISTGAPVPVMNYPDVDLYYDIWGYEDGTKIVGGAGNTFRHSSNIQEDLVYSGQLEPGYRIRSLIHSTTLGKIYCLMRSDIASSVISKVSVYEDDFLNPMDNIYAYSYAVPGIEGGYNFYPPDCLFVFINSGNDKLIVVTQASEGSGLYYDYAIQLINI
jgi:hypothetical protein